MECEIVSKKKRIVNFFLSKGVLASPDFLNHIDDINTKEELQELFLSEDIPREILVLNKDISNILSEKKGKEINWLELEKTKVFSEKGKRTDTYSSFLDSINVVEQKHEIIEEKKDEDNPVEVVSSYDDVPQKKNIQDFVKYFNARYKSIEKILQNRSELQNLTSINRILQKKEKENLAFVGIVSSKQFTKNNNLMLVLEDATGEIKVLVNKNKPQMLEQAKEIVEDEVIGVLGVNGENIVFANNIVWPEIPLNRPIKKSPDLAYAAFLSDLHVGSNNFLKDDLDKFIKWLNCEVGNDKQKEIAKNIKYLFIAGDTVDGVGIYPNQESELEIDDVGEQYKECARILSNVPKRIKIIVCPGNHDAQRISEPQTALEPTFAQPIADLPNVTLVSNPAVINIHKKGTFPGFDVLLYHGYSFDYYVSNVDTIRESGGYNRGDIIMKFLLKRRHLAPTHKSTLYVPDNEKDPLVITSIPDFFVTGHIHKSIVGNYRSITTVSCSCWQSKTSFQEKVGHNPEPSRVPIVNLQTREIKILKFGD